jgi:hypothetical protein
MHEMDNFKTRPIRLHFEESNGEKDYVYGNFEYKLLFT